MTKCSIVGCGAKYRKNEPNLTFHRWPKNEEKKQKWMDIIKTENIIPSTKEFFICSLHFETSDYNLTLDRPRLRDEAIPSRIHVTSSPSKSRRGKVILITEDMPISDTQTKLSLNRGPDSQNILEKEQTALITFNNLYPKVQDKSARLIERLQKRCQIQRLKVRRLTTQVRRQKKRICYLRNVIKSMQNQNSLFNKDSAIILNKTETPNSLVEQQMPELKELPCDAKLQNSEETRKCIVYFHSPGI